MISVFHHSRYSFCNLPPTTNIYTLSLHDALPIYTSSSVLFPATVGARSSHRNLGIATVRSFPDLGKPRSEEHTSELQSHSDLVCRLLLEKKKKKRNASSSIFLLIIKHLSLRLNLD